jgi:hypothetical protein
LKRYFEIIWTGIWGDFSDAQDFDLHEYNS